MNFLEILNEKQRQAVTAPKEPLMVLAGPGTGKTRTLVARILYLIRHYEIAPHRIMAITFTNKAKDEMRHRLREELGDIASDLHIGTFHHYCLELLRAHYHEANLPKQFAIADDMGQLMTLSRASHIRDERSLRTVLNAISSYRLNSRSLNPNLQQIALKWLKPYHRELVKNHLIDFDQILLLASELLTKYPDIAARQQECFDAILVDEFQDTDPIQYEMLRLLAWQHRNIFAVADDDQSIFAWRGAHTGNINRFVEEFECQDRVIVLNENYRSAQCIIDIATQLLQSHRFVEKEIVAAGGADSGPLPPQRDFLPFADDEEETQFILEQIQALTQNPSPDPSPKERGEPLRYADIAILYPTHAIGEYFESRLLAAHVPCQLVKRQGVFDQEDVKKILLLLKLLQNPEDDVTLEQYIELELNNPLVFEQIKSWKTSRRSFKQTLLRGMRYEKLSGMSKGQFRKTISTCFGTISNLLSYIEQNPNSTLEELIKRICNLTEPGHSLSIHRHVQRLLDPYEITGLPQAVEKIRALSGKDEGTLYVRGSDSEIERICAALLQELQELGISRNRSRGEAAQIPSWEGQGVGNAATDDQFPSWEGQGVGKKVVELHETEPTPDPSQDGISRSRSGSNKEKLTSALSNTDLFLCLDQQAAENLLQNAPEIAPQQIILLTSPADVDADAERSVKARHANNSPIEGGQGGGNASFKKGCLTITSPFTAAVTVFKLLQALSTADARKPFRDYVVLDLETTSGDTRTTRVVEIGAVKVRDGKIVDTFGMLVNPEQPITQGAYKVHGISEEDVRDQKTFKELLPELLDFLGDDMLVAHNGFGFDFPILLRLYREATGHLLPNRRFDTLPLARRLFPGQPASVDALMQRFKIQDTGNRHRALDDTMFLAPIFERLQEVEHSVNRRSEHEELLELVSLGIFLENADLLTTEECKTAFAQEERLLFQPGAHKLLSRFSDLPQQFHPLLEQYQPEIEVLAVFDPSPKGGEETPLPVEEGPEEGSQARNFFSGRDIAITRLKELARTFTSTGSAQQTETIHDAISQFLDHATLYTSQDDLCDVNAVNLLTIHSAKGLEFPVVFVAGVEKGNLPSFYAVREEGELREQKLDEQRRLFYVAMTRAKQRLFVTYVNKRGDFPKKRSQFLIELGIETQEDVKEDEAAETTPTK